MNGLVQGFHGAPLMILVSAWLSAATRSRSPMPPPGSGNCLSGLDDRPAGSRAVAAGLRLLRYAPRPGSLPPPVPDRHCAVPHPVPGRPGDPPERHETRRDRGRGEPAEADLTGLVGDLVHRDVVELLGQCRHWYSSTRSGQCHVPPRWFSSSCRTSTLKKRPAGFITASETRGESPADRTAVTVAARHSLPYSPPGV